MSRNVSITLQNTQDTPAIVDAILADNPDARRNDFPSMTKIDCPGRMEIRAGSVSDRIGRPWDPQEIHLCVISLSGSIDEDDDIFTIFWR